MADNSGDPLGKALVSARDAEEGRRANFNNTWQSVMRYCLPHEATFTQKREPGQLRNRHVLDSTAPRAVELAASSLHTLMNNPASQWFRLGLEGEDRPSPSERRYLQNAEKIMMRHFERKHSNVYTLSFRTFISLLTAGTGVAFCEPAQGGGLALRHYGMQRTWLSVGHHGLVDRVFRSWEWDARQAAGRFDPRLLSTPTQTALASVEQEHASKAEYLHAVFPSNDPVLGRLLPARFQLAPFAAAYVDVQQRRTLELGLYYEFPYMTPRWYLTDDEVYGRSPAMTALPDIRMANRMRETILRGAEKLVDPPLLIPDGGLLSPIRSYPGGQTFTDGSQKVEPLIPPGASRIEMGNELLQQVVNSIREAFFVPLFVQEDSPVRTATEVLQRQGERNRAISPMLVRLHTEFYTPLIMRAFKVLERQGAFGPVPASLENKTLVAHYISPLTASQQEADALAVMRWFEGLAPWAGVDKGVMDWADADELSQFLGRALGVPEQLIRMSNVVRGLRAARQAAEQQQMQQQLMLQGGEVAAKLIAAQPEAA